MMRLIMGAMRFQVRIQLQGDILTSGCRRR